MGMGRGIGYWGRKGDRWDLLAAEKVLAAHESRN